MAQFDIHQRVALDKAAQEDVYMLDLATTAENATDQTHGLIASTLQLAERRFRAYLKVVPFELKDDAMIYISDKSDEILFDRLQKARRCAAH